MSTWVIAGFALTVAAFFITSYASKAKQTAPENVPALDAEKTLSSKSASATDRVRRLLAVPAAARDANWATELGEQLPRASFRMLGDVSILGPNGFPCLALSTTLADDARRGFDNVLQTALDGGLGILINPNARGAVLEMSFGALASYKMFKTWRVPADWIGGEAALGIEVMQRSEEIVIASPNEEYLPQFVRNALRRYLESAGVRDPRVLIIIWPDRANHRDLAFSIERAAFSTPEGYQRFMRSLTWFLPNGYQYIDWDFLKADKSGASSL